MTVVAPRAIKKSLLHFPPVILEIWRLLSLVGLFYLMPIAPNGPSQCLNGTGALAKIEQGIF
jgi:hypothetical protein